MLLEVGHEQSGPSGLDPAELIVLASVAAFVLGLALARWWAPLLVTASTAIYYMVVWAAELSGGLWAIGLFLLTVLSLLSSAAGLSLGLLIPRKESPRYTVAGILELVAGISMLGIAAYWLLPLLASWRSGYAEPADLVLRLVAMAPLVGLAVRELRIFHAASRDLNRGDPQPATKYRPRQSVTVAATLGLLIFGGLVVWLGGGDVAEVLWPVSLQARLPLLALGLTLVGLGVRELTLLTRARPH